MQNFGKSCLITKILARAEQIGCETATLSFDLADRAVLTDLEKFSRWLCVAVGQKLRRANRLADSWEEMLSCNYNTTVYFQNYRTRIPVWVLEGFRRLGCSDVGLLESYPHLSSADLANAWAYAEAHPEEIATAIRENEEA